MSGPNGVVAKPPAPSDAAAAGAARALPAICYELRRKVLAFLDEKTDDKVLRSVQSRTRHSIAVIEEALRRYRPEQLSLSYNGGKDCLVLLILILACLPTRPSASASETNANSNTDIAQPNNTSSSPQTLKAIYIVSKHPFPEVESFVAASTTEYHLDLDRYAMAMRPALEAYIAEKPDVKAVFMGTRRTDPHAESLTDFAPTDGDWPQIMRVHPVIDWQYAEIWGFIRHLDIPFCSLYNQGFTSLGGLYDTRPNPALALDDSAKTFRPAYELIHDDEERLGRDR